MIVLVAGGTGFLGSHVVKLLQKEGHDVVVYHSKLRAVPTYADVIVNCAGIIREGKHTFQETHVDVTEFLLRLGKKFTVRQFVQVSAIGANLDGVPYQRTKRQGEMLVERSGLPFVIIRPSLIFGPGDKSVGLFRKIARTGFLPLFADAKVQPVHVKTVASLIAAAVDRRVRNRIVELGGPEVFTYRELADRIHRGVRAFRLPGIVRGVFALMGEAFSGFPTQDMITMMQQDNTTRDKTVDRLRIKNPRLQ